MKLKRVAGILGILGAAAVLVATSPGTGISRQGVNIPTYSLLSVPQSHCSRYVRFAARDMFGEKVPAANAWDLRYDAKKVINLNGLNLDELAKSGGILPGDVIEMRDEFSIHLNGIDKQGDVKKCNHVALYVGLGKDGKPYFAEQRGLFTYLSSAEELKGRPVGALRFSP